MSFIIDYCDHYSYFDKSISVYNFLRYPALVWKLFNSSLHYQNRLRHRDYLNLIKSAGFEISEESIGEPVKDDIGKMKNIPLAEVFKKRYKPNELIPQCSHLILKK